MRILQAIPATAEAYDLAEGPVSDPVRQRLLSVDIQRGLVLSGDLEADGTVSAIARSPVPGHGRRGRDRARRRIGSSPAHPHS